MDKLDSRIGIGAIQIINSLILVEIGILNYDMSKNNITEIQKVLKT